MPLRYDIGGEIMEADKMVNDFYFAEITDGEYQLVLPVGKFHTRKYGELEITPEDVAMMADNYKNKAMADRQPFIDIDHMGGVSNGWITDMKADEKGLYAKIEWTDVGRENIENKRYKYFSTSFGEVKDIKTGKVIKNVVPAISLTNQPVIYTMPEVHLSEQEDIVTHDNKSKDKKMDFKEIKDFRFSDAEKDELSKMLGFAEKIKVIEAEKTELSEKLAAKDEVIKAKDAEIAKLSEYKKGVQAKEIEGVIAKALSEGRIKPVDKDKWQKRLEGDFKGFSEILAEIPANGAVDMSEYGSAENKDVELSEAKKAAEILLPKGVFQNLFGKKQEVK